MKLTTCILLHDDVTRWRDAVRSAKEMGAVMVGDCNSGLDLRSLRAEGAEVVKIDFKDNYSEAKNTLLSKVATVWTLVLDPWECMVAGQEAVATAVAGEPKPYRLHVIQGTVLTKEVRMWPTATGLRFVNPVYEFVNATGPLLPAYVSNKAKPDVGLRLRLIEKWKRGRATTPEPYYYHACALLSEGRYDDFRREAEHYLFREQTGISAVMLNYYAAMVELYEKKDVEGAIRRIMGCLAVKPTMAEFWCLLGDAYYKIKDYDRAHSFYLNATLLGSRRLSSDDWPMEIPKYKEYPEKMISSCRRIRENSVRIG